MNSNGPTIVTISTDQVEIANVGPDPSTRDTGVKTAPQVETNDY